MAVWWMVIGLIVGVVLGWLAARVRSAAQVARLDATLRATQDGRAQLEQSLRALSLQAARDQQGGLADVVVPLREALHRYEQRVTALEGERVDAYAELRTEVRQMQAVSTALRTETGQLVAALRAPQVRGRWGEHQLRRIIEAAGMLEHCDFSEQVTADTDGGKVRPDVVVHLTGGRHLVIDAKVPLHAYLNATQATDDATRLDLLDQHAKHLRGQVNALAGKAYWAAFEQTPEFVVLFIPADAILEAALSRDPALLEYAFERNVVLATPAILIALLRTIAYIWRQDALSQNALAVHRLGKELHQRLFGMVGHLTKLGSSLGNAVGAYNEAIGSLESRVLISARKLADLGVSGHELTTPAQVDRVPRQLRAPEPVTAATPGP